MKKLILMLGVAMGLFAMPCVARVPASTSTMTLSVAKGQVALESGFIEILHRHTRLGLILSFR